MKIREIISLGVLLSMGSPAVGATGMKETSTYAVPPVLAGGAGIYLSAEKGTLHVAISKRDLNLHDKYQNNVYAYLLSPDRRLVAETHLVDDDAPAGSGPGIESTATLSALVSRPGVYLLLVVPMGFDGKRHDVVWGFSTNASKYMICQAEISQMRGKTPIRLINHEAAPLDLYFQPSLKKFSITAKGLDGAAGEITVISPLDEQTKLPIDPDKAQTRKFTTPLDGAIWKAALGDLSVSLDIKGVTSWGTWGGFSFENHGFWTFHKDAFFSQAAWRWILTPYYSLQKVTPQESRGEVTLQMHNHSPSLSARFRVDVESPENARILLSPGESEIELAPGETRPLKVRFETRGTGPLAQAEDHGIRVTALDESGFTTYSTLHFFARKKDGPLQLPVIYKPFSHIAEQYDYVADYPLNQVDFDPSNRPYIRQYITRQKTDGVYFKEKGAWKLAGFVDAIRKAMPDFQETERGSTFFSTRTAFDDGGGIYTTIAASATGKAQDAVRLLLYQPGKDAEFQAFVLDEPGIGTVDLEGFTGHNTSAWPPPVVLYSKSPEPEPDDGEDERFKVPTVLTLILPEKKKDGTLSVDKRIILSRKAINLCTHSGGASTIVSKGDKVHVIYGEVVDDSEKVPGVPTYMVTYHRDSGKIDGPVLVGYAPPVNDMHNSSGLTMDSRGILHVLLGAHGEKPFQYTHSLKPDSILDGWSNPGVVCVDGLKNKGVGPGEKGAQTYVGLVCGKDNTLYSAFRQDFRNVNGHFPDYNDRYRALSVQRKKPGKAWETPVPVIIPPLPGYSVYYHKLTIDREGRLFLFFTYRPGNSIYRSEMPETGNYAALLRSSDGGDSWQLVENGDFRP